MDKIKVIITDDSDFVRDGMRIILDVDEDFEVIGCARNGREAIEIAKESTPDILLMDIQMPEMDGIEATKYIVEVVPVSQTNLVTIVITDKGHVEHKNMQLEERVSLSEIKQTVDLINKFIIGTPLNEVSMKLEYEVKPKIASSLKEQQAIYEALYNAFNEFKTEEENMVKVEKQ